MIEISAVADVARVQARERPGEVALWHDGRQTTYAELDALSSRCANALIAAGIRPGDHVGVLAKGNDDFFILWMGALKARACLTPVNWRLAPPEIAFILKDAGARYGVRVLLQIHSHDEEFEFMTKEEVVDSARSPRTH